MTEEVTPKEVFEGLNVTKILMAILETQKEIIVPINNFRNITEEEKSLQVDYDEDTLNFTFKFKEEDAAENLVENNE
jgi:hypothetical protein